MFSILSLVVELEEQIKLYMQGSFIFICNYPLAVELIVIPYSCEPFSLMKQAMQGCTRTQDSPKLVNLGEKLNQL